MDSRRVRSSRSKQGGVARTVAALGAVAATVITSLALPMAAQAAPGDPFDPSTPQVFIGQDSPTQLYTAVQAAGQVAFEAVGVPADFTYNSIGYRTADNYMYGTLNGSNHLVRIGQEGVATDLGAIEGLPVPTDGYNQGVFGEGALADVYYVRDQAAPARMWAIDTETLAATQIPLSPTVPNVSDITFKDGFLWGMFRDGTMYRIDPASGAVESFATGLPLDTDFGAQWVYGNGNFGFSANTTGTVYQVAIEGAATAAPTFSLVSSIPGPSSSNNDGTSIMGLPADLALEKTGPTSYSVGDSVEYTITVTNNGPGESSGSTIADVLPASLVDVVTSSDGCTITDGVLDCVLGVLAAGESSEVTVTAVVADAATGDIVNTASVTGNEEDPDPDNNEGTTTATPGAPSIAIVKSASVTEITAAGTPVVYSFEVTNTGNVDLTDVSVSEGAFSGTGTLSAIDCPAAVLAVGADMVCEATYTTTQADVDAGDITNVATAVGTPPGATTPIESPESEVQVPAAQAPELALVKSATPSDSASYVQDEVITYTFAVTNVGNVTVDDIAIDEGSFTGTGTLSEIVCADLVLAPAAVTTCEATYTLTQADVDNGEITNTATATGVDPTGEPVTSPESSVTIPGAPAPALALLKTADTEIVTEAGEEITYSFLVTNTGNVTIDDVSVDETEFNGAGTTPEVVCPEIILAPGASVTCTAVYTVVAADLELDTLSNTAVAAGEGPDGTPVSSDPSTAVITPAGVPAPEPTPGPATPASPTLPATGADVPWIGLAAAMLMLGVGLVLVIRRERKVL